MDARPPVRPPAAIGAAKQSLPVSRSVLLLVDVINPFDFEGAEDIAPAATHAAKITAALKGRWQARGRPVIYANDNYGAWQSDFRQVLEGCLQRGGAAAEIARLLRPGERDLTILKPRHSAFYQTPLPLLLAQMQVRRIVIAGLAADICVQVTAMDAFLRGYRVWVPEDCTAAESEQGKRDALAAMARSFRAETRPVGPLLQRGGTPFAG